MDNRRNPARLKTLAIIAAAAAVIFFGRLYNLQIINGDSYLERSTKRISRTSTITAPRGEILDRFGRPLVTNRMSFSIVFDATTWDKSRREEILSRLLSLCAAEGQEYIDTLPVSAAPPYSYIYGEGTSSEKDIAEYLKGRKWPSDTSAADFISRLSERFELSDTISPELRRAVCGICYEMDTRGFSKTQPYTFARDVDLEFVTKIKEHSRSLPGVMIEVEPIREYRTSAAAHLLGRVGIIYKDEYKELKSQGYGLTDLIGKDGIEKAYESYLRGIDGSRTTETTASGKTTKVLYEDPPVLGKNCVLTIDLKVQEAAEKALSEIVPKLRREGKTNTRWGGGDSKGAALVAIDVKTGGVLALASYPTYDITTYTKSYNSLASDPLLPLFNRAISGVYPPGSTFKMVTALTALENGVVSPSQKIDTKGRYMFYAPSTTPMCDIFRQYGKVHGKIDVSEAIKVSCNYFFFEVGRLSGIDAISDYAHRFGFGEKTGIELAGESRGIVASKEYRESKNLPWYPGETLSAAIGQSDTSVTPIQLANYIAQLANGGVRYTPHLLKCLRDPDTNRILMETEPEVASSLELNPQNLRAVLEGMRAGAQEAGGTSASVFLNYPVSVGGKTGSAQAPGGSHALYVAFAPFEDPEIAVAVIVENGGQGSRIPSVARDVFDAYFASSFENVSRTKEGILLS